MPDSVTDPDTDAVSVVVALGLVVTVQVPVGVMDWVVVKEGVTVNVPDVVHDGVEATEIVGDELTDTVVVVSCEAEPVAGGVIVIESDGVVDGDLDSDTVSEPVDDTENDCEADGDDDIEIESDLSVVELEQPLIVKVNVFEDDAD